MKSKFYKYSTTACFCMLLAICALNFVSCQELSIDSQSELPLKMEVDAQPEYTLLALIPRNVVFTVSSNTPWRIESDQNWCIPTPALSSASSLIAEVTVVTEKNETEQPRTATLTIKAENINQAQIIKIVQDAKGKLEVQPIEELFTAEGNTKLFTVCANKNWAITSSSVWLTFDKNAGTGDNQVTQILATATQNSGSKRKATITIKSGLEEKVFEVTQDGVVIELPEISLEQATFLSTGESHTYQVTANTAWKAELVDNNVDWVTVSATDKALTVKTAYNKTLTNREAKIRLLPKNTVQGMEEIILTIHQKNNFWSQKDADNTITYDTKGAATLTIVKGRARFATNAAQKLGRFTWNFSSMNISDGKSYFELNAWPDSGNSNYHVYLGLNKHEFVCGGGFDWESKDLNLTQSDLDNLKKMTVVVEHDPENVGKLRLSLLLNDKEVAVMKNHANPYVDSSVVGTPFYFGFNDCLSPASCVIESFEAITID